MSSRLSLARALVLCTLAGIAVPTMMVGCAEPRAPINRVQPGALHRSVFEGEWYVQQTVIDSPYSAGYTFVGEQGELERIVWDIQEDVLVARRAYEFIAGSEPNGISGDATEHGAAVAMYAIESHFDIRRDYNPLTGEEVNVLGENAVDRPWYSRDYIRVDWSRNLITESDFLAITRVLDGIRAEPVAYVTDDPNHPHAPRFETRDPATGTWQSRSIENPIPAGQRIEYMDIVNKMFVQPQNVYIDGFGDIPSCYLLYQDHLDCAPGEITVRNSFLHVPEDRDYQPALYTGDRMQRFGYFVTERAGYDDHYGVVEPARFRFANRHNVWMQSHRRGADDQPIACVDDIACEDVPGSRCDLDLARAYRTTDSTGRLQGSCTIPFRDREIRPIAYYTTSNFPEDLDADADHLTDQWNTAFVDTVSSLRELECQQTGGDAEACAAERTREDHQRIFVRCHSPVREADADACGAVGTEARAGDLRYSIIGWVNDPHLSSPLGYGPSSADPLTGEIIMGNAFVYGAAVETLTSYARDIIAVLNGDLSTDAVSAGDNVEAWVQRMSAPGSLETGHPADDHAVRVDGDDAAMFSRSMDFSWARDAHSGSHPPRSPAEMIEAMRDARAALVEQGAFGRGGDPDARISNLFGSEIERQMTGTEMRMMAGLDPALPLTDASLAAASPLRGNSLAQRSAMTRARNMLHADHCILDQTFTDDGLLGLARSIQRAATSGDGTMEWYGQTYQLTNDAGELDYDLIRSMLRHPIFDAVTAHEVGHTIGLRHNFSGSYDALNYQARYWELRDDGMMMPRAWDPMSETETENRILEYSYATVMDYGVNFVVTDAHGISHYDTAAIKMGYGDLVEVFSNTSNAADVAWWNFIQNAGWPVPLRLESFTGDEPSAYTYTEWPEVVGSVAALQQRADVPYTSLQSERFLRSQGIRDAVVDASGRPAVPYMFCSDEQADLNPDCLRYDQGADAYESLQSVMDTYWNYYVFTNFRRQRLGFTPEAVAARVHDRYFEKLQRANQIYALYRGTFESIWGTGPALDRFYTRPDGMGAWTTAVGASFELLTRVVTAPEPGTYRQGTRGDGTDALLSGDGGAFGLGTTTVSGFDGRYMSTTWDFDAGYFWFDQLDRVGYFYDKVNALAVLVDPTTYFLGRDTDSDVRTYQINFGSSFGPALSAFMGGVMSEDWTLIAPRPSADGLAFPSPEQLTARSMPGVPVDPAAGFSIQLYASVFGMGYIPQTYDQSFLDRSRIFVRGGAEEVSIAAGTPTVEFTDTASGLTYVAVSYPTADGRETGVGAGMIEHALALEAAGATTELRRYVDNLDVVRRLSWQLGFGAQP